MQPPFQIGPITIDPALLLAPMSGVTDAPFRQLVKRCSGEHVGLVVTEFIAVELLTRAELKAHKQLRYAPEEHPIAVQLFGGDMHMMLEAADMVQSSGADILDINCGCPAPKVVQRGGGAGLLRRIDHLHRMLCRLTERLDIPVTLKIRNGWDAEHMVAHEVLDCAEDAGVSMLAIHGRTRKQLYRGEPDWEIVRELAARARIPIVGSGNITDGTVAKRRLYETGCAGLMVGRAAIKNPFIFRQIHEAHQGVAVVQPSLPDVVDALKYYFERLKSYHKPRWVKARMKRMGAAMIYGYPDSAKLRARLYALKTPEAMMNVIEQFSQHVAPQIPAQTGYSPRQTPSTRAPKVR